MRRPLVVLAVVALVLATTTPAWAAPGPSGSPEWWFDSWGVPALWAQGADGRGITIAEIDSGVAPLPQFAGKLLAGTNYGAAGGNGQTDHEIDQFGHGTAMASIMVAAPGPFGVEGTAPGATVLPIAIPLAGTDDASNNDHLDEAIRYAADHGAQIINMSIGEDRQPATDPVACDVQEQAAVTYAVSKGLILVAASGNDGLTGNSAADPGVCLGVLAVGAVDSTDTIADFSSRHEYTDLVAPGVNVPSLGRIVGHAYSGDGTSQAAALTSAAIALVWSKYPQLSNAQVLQRVFASLDHPRSPRDPAYGYGQINPQRAIATTPPATATEPVISAVAPFVAQQAAVASAAATPALPTTHPAAGPPGHYVAGAPASRITTRVTLGAVVALLGLLALIGLTISRARRRSRDRSAVSTLAAEPIQRADDGP